MSIRESTGKLHCTYCLDVSGTELIFHWTPRKTLAVVSVKEKETHIKWTMRDLRLSWLLLNNVSNPFTAIVAYLVN